ncbi:MAG: NAD(P)-dependent oxidoreductase, partial [Ramlibacter sp.]
LAGVLALARNFPHFLAAQREKRWDQRQPQGLPCDLRTQTALIVGWGPVAKEIARLLVAIGVQCIAVRRNAGEPAEGGVGMICFAELKANLGRADWLILACPLTEVTRSLVDSAHLDLLPAGARVINVARGEVIVQADLIAALQAGRLAGAYLDVTEPEPLPPDSPLWTLDNVILTPHTAGHANTNAERVASMFLENLARWRDGLALLNLCP